MCVWCVCGVCVLCFGAKECKEYAMRDSNPQPPDSKSDTLSIAPTAPRKRLHSQQQTTTPPLNTQQRRTTNYKLHTTHDTRHTTRTHTLHTATHTRLLPSLDPRTAPARHPTHEHSRNEHHKHGTDQHLPTDACTVQTNAHQQQTRYAAQEDGEAGIDTNPRQKHKPETAD